jgi:hypothetical protein
MVSQIDPYVIVTEVMRVLCAGCSASGLLTSTSVRSALGVTMSRVR